MLNEPFKLVKKTYPYATQHVDASIQKKYDLKVIIAISHTKMYP